jgi:hypothetical protein
MSKPDDSVTDIQGSDVNNRATQIFANCFLELRAKHNVSLSAIDFIAKNIGGIFNGIAEFFNLKQDWTVVLPIVERVTLGLNCNVERNRYYAKNFGFVKPVQKCVGSPPELVVNSRVEKHSKSSTFRACLSSQHVVRVACRGDVTCVTYVVGVDVRTVT